MVGVTATPLAPTIVGGVAWITVQTSSPLGDMVTAVGPIAPWLVTPQLTSDVTDRVQYLVSRAGDAAAKAIAADSALCSRCVRSVMRAAAGSIEDASRIVVPQKDGDRERYAAAFQAVNQDFQRVQQSLTELSSEAAVGRVRSAEDANLQVSGAAWSPYYEGAGAPMHVGQWSDYKLCACGDPTVNASKPTMVVSGDPHTGGCGPDCGCASCRAA